MPLNKRVVVKSYVLKLRRNAVSNCRFFSLQPFLFTIWPLQIQRFFLKLVLRTSTLITVIASFHLCMFSSCIPTHKARYSLTSSSGRRSWTCPHGLNANPGIIWAIRMEIHQTHSTHNSDIREGNPTQQNADLSYMYHNCN